MDEEMREVIVGIEEGQLEKSKRERFAGMLGWSDAEIDNIWSLGGRHKNYNILINKVPFTHLAFL